MRKTIIVLILIFTFYIGGQSARIITGFDIARWYLDSDLVLICNVKQVDSFKISHHDTLVDKDTHIRYDIIREKYQISIDSIIKCGQLINETMDTIFTPDFLTNYSKTQEKKEFSGFDSKGDSVFIGQVKMYNNNYYDDTYFRLNSQEKHLVILRKMAIGYVIDYASDCNEITLNLIREVKLKGEDYFSKTK